jgi:hypothetical protein
MGASFERSEMMNHENTKAGKHENDFVISLFRNFVICVDSYALENSDERRNLEAWSFGGRGGGKPCCGPGVRG